MATSEKKVTYTLTIQLSEIEAEWLRSNLQNPLGGLTPIEESETDSMIRKAIWDALEVITV